ncbi:DEAD/DEAH box helicase [Streptococcus equi]|uniref:DEAD/DEAH box helicase n=1 Tax=Streptococcus equi TaxID=1336 RepID=UPI0005BB32B4|nr:DEAD/DEAH box helicase [Streptococcus equi]KIS06134.1 competence protein ComF [Streptococcus equi subsp. zooepidemicus Sz5]
MENIENYYGRLLPERQCPKAVSAWACSLQSMIAKKGTLYCQRCSSLIEKAHQLPSGAYYCRACLVFGRNQSDRPLLYFPPAPFPKGHYLRWQGQLTTYQVAVSHQLTNHVKLKQDTLVHAVTGAGKTEMMYEAIAAVVDKGGWVCIASPRVDVCIELEKRLSRDFSCQVCLMHAESEVYHRSPIIVATTHQLMTFYHAFDLLIIDEVDAFPFVNNRQLNHAAHQAAKADAVTVYLTATSTRDLERKVKQKELVKLTLARRFHGKPLVVPKYQRLFSLLEAINRGKLPRRFITLVKKQRATGYPLLIFFPIIELAEQCCQLLQKYFPKETIAHASSQSSNRMTIIEQFRQGQITILISTTILERGVTFPTVDVFVLLANHRLYTSSSLIQISGRVGRSLERPEGQVLFFHDGISKAMLKAVREIKDMNQKGYQNELSTLSQ